MKTLARLLLVLVFWSGAAVAADTAVVLMYHRFGDDRFPSTSIRTEQFRAHLDYLADNDFTVVTLTEFVDAFTGRADLPERAVLITIDDAFQSIHDVAHPLLNEYGFPYTVFVATDPVDQGLRDYMTWEQMREMQSEGASFANHGAAHRSTIDRSGSGDYLRATVDDIETGMLRLRTELNPVEGVFAYPYGEYNAAVTQTLKALDYKIAFGQHSGAAGPITDRLAMPRFPMNEAYGGMDQFPTKVKSLPLPVATVTPGDTEIITRLPLIEVQLSGGADAGDYAGLACFVGGQGQVMVDWVSPGRRFRVGPEKPFGLGRQRVNCTAPAGGGRYYWYSHPWFVIQPD